MRREKLLLIAKELHENPKTLEQELVTVGTYEISGTIAPVSTRELDGVNPSDLVGATEMLKAYLPYSAPKFFPKSQIKRGEEIFETVGDVLVYGRGRRTRHKEVLVRRVSHG